MFSILRCIVIILLNKMLARNLLILYLSQTLGILMHGVARAQLNLAFARSFITWFINKNSAKKYSLQPVFTTGKFDMPCILVALRSEHSQRSHRSRQGKVSIYCRFQVSYDTLSCKGGGNNIIKMKLNAPFFRLVVCSRQWSSIAPSQCYSWPWLRHCQYLRWMSFT